MFDFQSMVEMIGLGLFKKEDCAFSKLHVLPFISWVRGNEVLRISEAFEWKEFRSLSRLVKKKKKKEQKQKFYIPGTLILTLYVRKKYQILFGYTTELRRLICPSCYYYHD